MARILPLSKSVSTMVTVVVPMSMAQPTSTVSVGAVISMQLKQPSFNSPLTHTFQLFSRRVWAILTMTAKGIFTFSTPKASSMAQVSRSASGMVSSRVGSLRCNTALR